MIFVKVRAVRAHLGAHVRYTPLDWRLDALQTRLCQACFEPAVFHDEQTAECPRCGFWFDGLVCGRLRTE